MWYRTGASTPGIVRILRNSLCVLIYDGDYIALQILQEVVGHTVIDNAADGILIVIQRNQNILISLRLLIIVPALTQNLSAIQNVIVLNSGNRLAGTDTVGIVGVGVTVKALQLAALLPGQGMTQIGGGIALGIGCVLCNILLAIRFPALFRRLTQD